MSDIDSANEGKASSAVWKTASQLDPYRELKLSERLNPKLSTGKSAEITAILSSLPPKVARISHKVERETITSSVVLQILPLERCGLDNSVFSPFGEQPIERRMLSQADENTLVNYLIDAGYNEVIMNRNPHDPVCTRHFISKTSTLHLWERM